MPTCYSRLPDRFEDGRHTAIEKGFAAAGFQVTKAQPHKPNPDDVLVTWNTYGNNETLARMFRRYVVAEEAYIRTIQGDKYFALGLNGHNGNNENPIGNEIRWRSWGIELKPWREAGGHILVCGQRGFGYNAMAMPDDWQDLILTAIRCHTSLPVWFRPHPKRRRRIPKVQYDRLLDWEEPLSQHLRDCWAMVVYTSNAATDALIAGVPAFFCGPNIITKGASQSGLADLMSPAYGDRSESFRRLSWSQFSMREIESGWAIQKILD